MLKNFNDCYFDLFDIQRCERLISVVLYRVCFLNKQLTLLLINNLLDYSLYFSVKMKCLLCSSTFQNQEDLLNHYISYHNVDENNWFFQKLFQIKNKSILKQCVRCKEFLTTEKHKNIHNFLRHYEEGKSVPFEE